MLMPAGYCGKLTNPSERSGEWSQQPFFGAYGKRETTDALMEYQPLYALLKPNV